MSHPVPKTRARTLILHWICEFSLSRTFGEKTYGGLRNSSFVADERAQVGDLVVLQSAPPSPFSLGWLIDYEIPTAAAPSYLIESIETGEQCWWSNVGMMFMPRQTVAEHSEWRWTDAQHAFNDRWLRACYKRRDAYMFLPVQAEFEGASGVVLRVRVRHNWQKTRPARSFSDWRKVTVQQMLEFYDAAVKECEAERTKP